MLLRGYRKEIFRPDCNPQFQSVHCIAHLDDDIREVLPYLNTVLGAHQYLTDPPTLMLMSHGKLITLHPTRIAVNALRDEDEADRVLKWLQHEINETWNRREEIEPSHLPAATPRILDILKLLPLTNCGECGQPTCIVFATVLAQGGKNPGDCPPLTDENRSRLDEYLAQFQRL